MYHICLIPLENLNHIVMFIDLSVLYLFSSNWISNLFPMSQLIIQSSELPFTCNLQRLFLLLIIVKTNYCTYHISINFSVKCKVYLITVTIGFEETRPPYTLVYNVTARDPEDQQVAYSLNVEPLGGSFEIDSKGKHVSILGCNFLLLHFTTDIWLTIFCI